METEELTRACRFSTDRLDVAEWHSVSLPAMELVDVVTMLLTPATTRSLPDGWQGEYDQSRAAGWIRERDDESVNLMVADLNTKMPVGLLILFESASLERHRKIDVRLGYVLTESTWGLGLATELVAGFVAWCRTTGRIGSIVGGVEPANPASSGVLIKNGFSPVDSVNKDEDIYELVMSDYD